MKLLNYFGMLRIYSFLDILVFSMALTRDVISIVFLSMLWYGAIFFNEWLQKDALRVRSSSFVHLALFVATLFYLPVWLVVGFYFFTFIYASKKKHPFFGVTAPLWRGGMNALMAFAFNPALVSISFVVTVLRNAIGDFRDAGYDKKDGTVTFVVSCGITKNYAWAYFVHMASIVVTTLLWGWYAGLSWQLISVIAVVEVVLYPLTPRASSPEWLNFYKSLAYKEEVIPAKLTPQGSVFDSEKREKQQEIR